jgi:hypothetical protein
VQVVGEDGEEERGGGRAASGRGAAGRRACCGSLGGAGGGLGGRHDRGGGGGGDERGAEDLLHLHFFFWDRWRRREREGEEMAARSMRLSRRPLNCFSEAFRGAASYSGAAGLARAAASNARCVVRWQPGPWVCPE